MLAWLLGVAADLVAFALGDEIPYEKRAQHIARERLYGSVASIFVGGLAGILLIFAIADRLDEPAQDVHQRRGIGLSPGTSARITGSGRR